MATREDQIKELKELIAIELDACNKLDWPYVCHMKLTKEGYLAIEKMVIEQCEQSGCTVQEAIARIERMYNPNKMED
jgi:uncharacterized CHY-type Zn-finger protein